MSDDTDEITVPPVGRVRPKKAPNAFRTISEVADELHIPQHVLRFWETRFPQVKPLKRGGGELAGPQPPRGHPPGRGGGAALLSPRPPRPAPSDPRSAVYSRLYHQG